MDDEALLSDTRWRQLCSKLEEITTQLEWMSTLLVKMARSQGVNVPDMEKKCLKVRDCEKSSVEKHTPEKIQEKLA